MASDEKKDKNKETAPKKIIQYSFRTINIQLPSDCFSSPPPEDALDVGDPLSVIYWLATGDVEH
jgi:hypothetical protein